MNLFYSEFEWCLPQTSAFQTCGTADFPTFAALCDFQHSSQPGHADCGLHSGSEAALVQHGEAEVGSQT